MAKHFGGTTMRIGSGTDTALISESGGELYVREGGSSDTIRMDDIYAAKIHTHSSGGTSGGISVSYDDLTDRPTFGDMAYATSGDYYAKADVDAWVITSGALALTSGSTEAYFTKAEIQDFFVGVVKQS